MTSKKFCCPLCGKALSKGEYLRITGRWEQLHNLEAEYQRKLKVEVHKARREERARVSDQVVVLNRRIVLLRGQLRRLKQQSERGLTPQLEGLLYEKELAKQLAQKFRQDRIIPAGKGGDVIHYVCLNGKRVGTIVYECKKVTKLQRGHVEQARRAMVQRSADFSVLVTTAKVANAFGFWIEKDVLLVHPAGALGLAAWLRESLIELAKARMPKTQREKAVREILAFLDSPSFRNAVQDAIRRTEELGRQLKEEVRSHRNLWLKRYDHYEAIWLDARCVAQGVAKILEAHSLPSNARKLLAPMPLEAKTYPVEKKTLFQWA